jgi:protocatechuate 3,4-dioxygenase beta subunit
MKEFNRRKFLTAGLGVTSVLGLSSLTRAGACLGLTPAQTEGPFYPVKDQPDEDWDLVRVNGHTREAIGEIIYISGTVTDKNCKPISGALVEIWQACASGRYDHPSDTNTAALDPDFQYWGKSVSDKDGKYGFRTILPGSYPADTDWIRPPHIHFKIHKLRFHELTTQLYFAGQALNDQDKILQQLSVQDKNKVVAKIKTDSSGKKGLEFDITLKSV